MEASYRTSPTEIKQLLLIPDTITINGDQLQFKAKSGNRLYQAFYTLKSKKEKAYFEKLWKLTVINVSADITEAEGKRNFKGFDYQDYLKTQKIYRLVSIKRINAMRIKSSWALKDWLSEWRRKAIVAIQQKFPSPMKHYMTGLLLGYLDKSFDEMSNIYSNLGIIHLFALSGMQVSFFIGKWRYWSLRLGAEQEHLNYLQILFSVLYAGLTGFSVSVVRSLLQNYLSKLGCKKQDSFALTILLLAILMPSFLLTAGGVLSLAFAFILLILDFEKCSKIKRFVLQTLSLSAGILPLLMWYFSSFQPLSMLLTVIFSFLFDCLMLPVLLIAFFLSPFLTLDCLNPAFIVLEKVIIFIHSHFSRPLVLGSPSLSILLLSLFLLAVLYDYRKQKKVLITVSIVLCFLLFFL
ncbi:competence protein [Streptococcus macacae NCTC 11558]|uniref:Competence protein n=1 Tax=Streptococcus macacae NCTC 11558 TaxID=764298 RepID=G5JVS9_9STRE|nr:competence protein [Streptococcus macacae NCTC 11558]